VYYNDINKCFVEYLSSKGIKCVDNFHDFNKVNGMTSSTIKEQINIISEFHRITLGYTGRMNKRLENNIGKTIEQYKVYIKRVDKQLKDIKENGANNKFEELLLNQGEFYLDRAKKCISIIYKNDYVGLILRSMERVEMCLGNTYFNNLRKRDNIEIIDMNCCSYNLSEMDVIYLLSKIKRKKIKVDFSNLALEFCELESLDNKSCNFILASMSYPCEFMKWCNRYRGNNKSFTKEQYDIKLKKAIVLDGESLI
jgi:hypothetical protein